MRLYNTPKWGLGEGKLLLSLCFCFTDFLTAVMTRSNFISQHSAEYLLLISEHCLPQKSQNKTHTHPPKTNHTNDKNRKKTWELLLSSSLGPRAEVVRKICSAPRRNYAADLVTKRRCPLSESACLTARPSFSSSYWVMSTYYLSFVLKFCQSFPKLI